MSSAAAASGSDSSRPRSSWLTMTTSQLRRPASTACGRSPRSVGVTRPSASRRRSQPCNAATRTRTSTASSIIPSAIGSSSPPTGASSVARDACVGAAARPGAAARFQAASAVAAGLLVVLEDEGVRHLLEDDCCHVAQLTQSVLRLGLRARRGDDRDRCSRPRRGPRRVQHRSSGRGASIRESIDRQRADHQQLDAIARPAQSGPLLSIGLSSVHAPVFLRAA